MVRKQASFVGLCGLVALYIIIFVNIDRSALLHQLPPPEEPSIPSQSSGGVKIQHSYNANFDYNNQYVAPSRKSPKKLRPFHGPVISFLNDKNESVTISALSQGGVGAFFGARKRRDNQEKPVIKFLEESARLTSILKDHGDPDVVNVLLYARYRGGSTFLGDFFRTNTELLYMFEPLKRGTNIYSPRQDTELILGQMFACNFDTIYKYTGAADFWLKQCVFCRYPDPVTACIRKLPEVSEEEVTSTCVKVKTRVIKTIRVETLNDMVGMMRKGVKVIQLVRDPRGTMSSRRAIYPPLRKDPNIFREEVRDLCVRAVKDVESLRQMTSKSPDLVTNNYLVVRYEDLARNASHWLAEIYRFMGRTPDTSARTWARNTESASLSNPRDTELNFFTTQRANPFYTSISWRRKLGYNEARVVEEECQTYLDMFGYDKVPSEEIQGNMSYSLIKDFQLISLLNP